MEHRPPDVAFSSPLASASQPDSTMGRKEHPQALTLERFAGGKDGRTNAFKKRKQANKRKLFEKAQLKRQYAKLLKKEGTSNATSSTELYGTSVREQEAYADAEPEDGNTQCTESQPKKRRRDGYEEGESEQRRVNRNGRAAWTRKRDTSNPSQRTRKDGHGMKESAHRPDPFRGAKMKADERRREAVDKNRERERLKAEKLARTRNRRKQHTLLSKRTRGGQPVMKNTMQHLLEKIQSQT